MPFRRGRIKPELFWPLAHGYDGRRSVAVLCVAAAFLAPTALLRQTVEPRDNTLVDALPRVGARRTDPPTRWSLNHIRSAVWRSGSTNVLLQEQRQGTHDRSPDGQQPIGVDVRQGGGLRLEGAVDLGVRLDLRIVRCRSELHQTAGECIDRRLNARVRRRGVLRENGTAGKSKSDCVRRTRVSKYVNGPITEGRPGNWTPSCALTSSC